MALPSTGYAIQAVTAGASLTDFTLIVDLSDMHADWWTANDTADGTKGRAAKDDETELATDWISFDSGANTGWLRVKWSGTLSGSVANTIRIYPPVAANSSNAPSATYGSYNAYDSDWKGYWPLDEAVNNDVDGYKDHTSNANHGQGVSMALTEVTGQVGNAQDFDGSADYINVPTFSHGTTIAVSAWVNSSLWARSQTVFTKLPSNQEWSLFFVGGNIRWGGGGSSPRLQYGHGLTNSTWHHFVAQQTGTDGELFIDAGSVIAGNVAAIGDDTTPGTNDIRIGSFESFFEYLGLIDDVQLHTALRSGDWWVEEFAQTDDNSTYWGVWVWNPLVTFDIIMVDTVYIKQLASDTVNIVQVDADTVGL